MSLIGNIEFLRFKKPKTKRCKTLILNVLPTPSLPPQGQVWRELGGKVTILFAIKQIFAYILYFFMMIF